MADCKKWPFALAPREKLMALGPSSLTDTELLAIFLRTGLPGVHVMKLAEELMRRFGSFDKLMCADRQTLCATKGLGVSKFTQLQAIREMAQRYYRSHMMREDAMTRPDIAQNYLQVLLAHREREVFVVLYLDNQHRLIKHQELFHGTVNSVEVHPREIIRAALKVNATALILAHNHPSGKAEPSRADREVTDQVSRAAALMDIRVLDHLVIGAGECVSFAQRGWL
ncbi:RadC family protein [Martelella alba]|uniref:JAB domain-containing protein n=1 Tax=Martelella alba TaxID=2590451 RepID=A0ABY2SG31_9HYPH|nr:DNA repair protein RadC [Martelella alba]TKI04034.1 JAB domain-containing protein [Martelella alba]